MKMVLPLHPFRALMVSVSLPAEGPEQVRGCFLDGCSLPAREPPHVLAEREVRSGEEEEGAFVTEGIGRLRNIQLLFGPLVEEALLPPIFDQAAGVTSVGRLVGQFDGQELARSGVCSPHALKGDNRHSCSLRVPCSRTLLTHRWQS